jgi:NADH-quinone oxidoreductase subunit A
MLSEFLKDYLPIIIFLIIALGLSCAFVVVNLILSPKHPDPEKLSAYECGFDPYEDARNNFDVRFYLIALLFLLFDLETIFFLPWSVSLSFLSLSGFSAMLDFVFELLVGLIYAWIVGALEWE